jgi:hypothetical protein
MDFGTGIGVSNWMALVDFMALVTWMAMVTVWLW